MAPAPSQTPLPNLHPLNILGGLLPGGLWMVAASAKTSNPCKTRGKKTKKKREKKRKSLSSSKERLPELQSWNFGGRRLEMPDVAPWEGPAARQQRSTEKFLFLFQRKAHSCPITAIIPRCWEDFVNPRGWLRFWGGLTLTWGLMGAFPAQEKIPFSPKAAATAWPLRPPCNLH